MLLTRRVKLQLPDHQSGIVYLYNPINGSFDDTILHVFKTMSLHDFHFLYALPQNKGLTFHAN